MDFEEMEQNWYSGHKKKKFLMTNGSFGPITMGSLAHNSPNANVVDKLGKIT